MRQRFNSSTEPPPAGSEPNPRTQLFLRVGAITVCRLALNTARRFAYPFAPALGRGLGVPLTDVTGLIAIAQATGIICLFSGPLTDRIGYRRMMALGLLAMVAGMLAGGLMPVYAIFCFALLSAGLGKFIFDPALQAYVGVYVPYHKRARTIGILEISWAGSTLLGIPAIGLLMHSWGWRAPFFFLGLLGAVGLFAVWHLLPRDEGSTAGSLRLGGLKSAWSHILQKPYALAALVFGFLISAANDMIFVVYGAWLEQDFGLSVVAIGAGTGIIGLAELSGELITAGFADRFGLKKSVAAGVLATGISYAGLYFFQNNSISALFGIFFIFLTFEFTIVTFLTLCTELMPTYRATMMSGFLAMAGLGRVAGAFIGVPVWQSGGIVLVGIVAAGVNLTALLIFIGGLRTWKRSSGN